MTVVPNVTDRGDGRLRMYDCTFMKIEQTIEYWHAPDISIRYRNIQYLMNRKSKHYKITHDYESVQFISETVFFLIIIFRDKLHLNLSASYFI